MPNEERWQYAQEQSQQRQQINHDKCGVKKVWHNDIPLIFISVDRYFGAISSVVPAMKASASN
ncbi:hypothetical protein GCM10010919_13140 [Alishewanella longhuensis]|uniref:Uncharacterized protein n=1 Tax=Alishewanella longhuensis TaxID=1091037 RepID=A0ABQ3KWN1_9ALTE|nr:hypothetical protein GCM10010919_13140 [Alishewanella longhuensis]